MQPWLEIARARAPDGTELRLDRRGDEWVVRCDGRVLMSTRQHGSEEALALLAFAQAPHAQDVFVGGLGLGFTARAALEKLPREGRLLIAEFTPEIVEWNRQHVGEFARRPLDDPRTRLHVGDAVAHLLRAHELYDALLLDIDNGPSALVHASNEALYGDKGVAACFAALRPGGVLTVWSASGDDGYLMRLERAGFMARAEFAGARAGSGRGVRHVIFVAVRPRAQSSKARTR